MSQDKDTESGGLDAIKLLAGRTFAVFGMLVGATVVFIANAAVTFSFIGIALGAVGYVLGARKLGLAAVIVAVVALVLGTMIINGMIPGLNPPGVDDNSPSR